MRLILTLAVASLYAASLSGQCPTQIPTWDQQKLIDTMALYPNCEHYDRILLIQGDALSDLTPLSNLKSVEGLTINGATSLNSLTGLEGITHVEQNVRVVNTPQLSDLDGLSGLMEVGGDFELSGMDGIISLDGTFPNLASVGGNFQIYNLNSIQQAGGFENLTRTGFFDFRSNNIRDFNAFAALEQTATFSIQGTELESVSGLSSLTDVDGSVQINASMLIELNALETVSGSCMIFECESVMLENLKTVGGWFAIIDGTNNLIGLNKLETVGEMLELTNLDLDQLPPFEELRLVGGKMRIVNNRNLTSIHGFRKLTSVGGGLWIASNDEMLTEVTGFNALENIGEDLYIRDNEVLREIDGFANLTRIDRDLSVWFNDQLDECSFLCPILENAEIGGDIRIVGNAGPCRSEKLLREYCDQPFVRLTMVDANPQLWTNFLEPVDNIIQVDAEKIIQNTHLVRDATCADGVSTVVLVAEFKEEGLAVFDFKGTKLGTPWGTESFEIEGRYYCLALYSPPNIFPEESEFFENNISRGFEEVKIFFSGEGAEVSESVVEVPLIRPPVVLVHSSLLGAEYTWGTSIDGMQSMRDYLEGEGIQTFAVDYNGTNGVDGQGSFVDNVETVYENPGGIKEAVEHYRDELKCAATQVDIVGHGMGGILARLWLSEYYNPEGYQRLDNYNKGDINRLITIGTMHYGSHLADFKYFLENRDIFSSPVEWLEGRAAALATNYLTSVQTSEALFDQVPITPDGMGQTLRNIGATEVPSHAIAGFVSRGKLDDNAYDPDSNYYYMYRYLAMIMYYSGALREGYLDHKRTLCAFDLCPNTDFDGNSVEIFDGLSEEEVFDLLYDKVETAMQRAGQIIEILDGNFEFPDNIQIFRYAMGEVGMGDLTDPLLDYFVFGLDPKIIVAKYIWNHWVLPEIEAYFAEPEPPMFEENMIEILRFLIFNNDENDGMVRVDSQTGELEKKCETCVTILEGVMHEYAPWNQSVQVKVYDLLTSGMEQFEATGFDAIEQPQEFFRPSDKLELYKPETNRVDAICNSGMLPEHAEAFARVADRRDAIIIVRPVNKDGTPLIASGAATKGMDVKPKSSDWGPQRGYLPFNQRYSKLSRIYKELDERNAIVEDYNARAMDNIENGIAGKRPLKIEACNGFFWVAIDRSKFGGDNDGMVFDEIVLLPDNVADYYCPLKDPEEFSPEDGVSTCMPKPPELVLDTLEVLTSPDQIDPETGELRYLTADYDLLMIGFNRGEGLEYDPPEGIPLLPEVGQITPEQYELVQQLNDEANHIGGNLVHHGPENQFSKSPYVDYPLTVFAPDEVPGASDGIILSIGMGSPGFRDINLKRYVNEMRSRGYDLYDNPAADGWQWTYNEDIPGFELTDSQNLGHYVNELKDRSCNRGDVNHCPEDPVAVSDAKPTAAVKPPPTGHLTVIPNPVSSTDISVNWESSVSQRVNWRIVNTMGLEFHSGSLKTTKGTVHISVNVEGLESGIYRFVTDTGEFKTFIVIR